MYDLVDECGKDLKEFGYHIKRLEKFSTTMAYLKIDSDENSQKLGMSKGEYYILNCPFVYDFGVDCFYYVSNLISKILKKIFKKNNVKKRSKILIIGLGNPDIPADRLGKEVFDNIKINPLAKKNNIFKFCPNIFFSTGINTTNMINMFIKELSVDFCVIIDSLTTSNISRLGTSFQITTSGMTPGSGVNRFGRRIDSKSTGIPCFSIGVPFMIFSRALDRDVKNDIILSPKDIKDNVANAGFIIANAINEVLKWTTIFLSHLL